MSETNQLVAEIQRLNAVEKRVIEQFIRKKATVEPGEATVSFGDRVADQVTAFGGSWTFIFVTLVAISVWMAINGLQTKSFDAERTHILAILKETRWVLAGPRGAAQRLGMNRSTLQFRMKKLGIERPTLVG